MRSMQSLREISRAELAASFAKNSGLFSVSRLVESALGGCLRIMAYHRISSLHPEPDYGADIELISSWASEFAWQMAHVSESYETPSPTEVFDSIARGKALPTNSVLVTFDDGFRDNWEVAFPILRKYRIPAMFFLSTGYIGSTRQFWFDRIVSAVLQTSVRRLSVDAIDEAFVIQEDTASRRKLCSHLLACLKSLSNRRRESAVEKIIADLGYERDENNSDQGSAMSWDQARDMRAGGMEFGSHSVSHPVLSAIESDAELYSELADSKSQIEDEIGVPIHALAYPVGGVSAYDARVVAAARKVGYRVGISYVRGVHTRRLTDPFAIRRIAVERDTSRARFMADLGLPSVFV